VTHRKDESSRTKFDIDFDRRSFQTLLRAGQTRMLSPSAVLCEDGQLARHCYVVTQGTVEVSKTIDGIHCALAEHGPGSVLALMATLDGGPCRISLRAAEETTVVEVGREVLFSLFRAGVDPDFGTGDDAALAERMTITAIRRLRAATDELAQAIHRSITIAKRPGHLGIADLASIHAGNHAWKAAA